MNMPNTTASSTNHPRAENAKNSESVTLKISKTSLESLPAELLKNIAGRLSRDDLRCFHLGGLILRNGSRDNFRDRFRELSIYPHQAISLKRLNEIANDGILGPKVRTLRLVVAHFVSKEEEERKKTQRMDELRTEGFDGPEMYNVKDEKHQWEYVRDRNYLTAQPLLTQGRNCQQLANVMYKLPGFVEVWICNLDDKTTPENYSRGLGFNTLSKAYGTKPLNKYPKYAASN